MVDAANKPADTGGGTPRVCEFDGPWPQVLHELLEFVRLQHLAHARGRRCQVQVQLAKALVPVQAVQPALDNFRRLLAQDYPGLGLQLQFQTRATHRVAIHFGP